MLWHLISQWDAMDFSGLQLSVVAGIRLDRQVEMSRSHSWILGAVLVVCAGSLKTYKPKNQTELLFCIIGVFV